MKRRKFLIALGVVPPLVLSACKEKVIPETIISAKVTDEKGNPLENIPFRFFGYRSYGGSVAGGGKKEDTFKLESKSDKSGNIVFSLSIPENTTSVYFSMGVTFIYAYYSIQAKKNGISIGSGSEVIDVHDSYDNSIKIGETNEYEIILTKK